MGVFFQFTFFYPEKWNIRIQLKHTFGMYCMSLSVAFQAGLLLHIQYGFIHLLLLFSFLFVYFSDYLQCLPWSTLDLFPSITLYMPVQSVSVLSTWASHRDLSFHRASAFTEFLHKLWISVLVLSVPLVSLLCPLMRPTDLPNVLVSHFSSLPSYSRNRYEKSRNWTDRNRLRTWNTNKKKNNVWM